jgi:capsule polysaccharide export protein KpsC/LpsZ
MTLEAVARITNVQCVIKIHPSEKKDNPLTGAQVFVERKLPELPAHMRLIRMDDDISPLDFYNLVDGCVTVFGTAGLELSLVGKPVILAGTPHYSRKGFTRDALNTKHYLYLLEEAS